MLSKTWVLIRTNIANAEREKLRSHFIRLFHLSAWNSFKEISQNYQLISTQGHHHTAGAYQCLE